MTKTTLQRLLEHPHRAVFEKSPGDELVFRLSHANGVAWSIAEGVMVVRAGALERSYNLRSTTVMGLIAALRTDGFTVAHTSSRFDGYSALVLTEGEGNHLESNGDHVTAFTSLLWVLFTAYSGEVNEAQRQIGQALLQMVIGTAEGEWLDLWGSLYSVGRLSGETDAAYRARIPQEAFRIRVNALAIELAILQLTGKAVRILEPWSSVFRLDMSALSGGDRFQDGARVGPFYIQPYSESPIDWSDVLPIIERNRPAGVLVLPPKSRIGTSIAVPGDYTAELGIRRRHTGVAVIEDMALLDFSDIEDVSVVNDPFKHRRRVLNGILVEYTGQYFNEIPWRDETWASQNIIVGSSHTSSS